jgi:4-amino-4-deoxy-L-arabinose transferase-like glycosyltransferase
MTPGGQSETQMTATRAAFDRATLAFLFVLIAVTAARIYALFHDPIGLYFDEAQYWMWSRSFEWGYFTKPPLIAWVIGLTTTLAGTDAEWAIRLGAPLAHVVAASALYALGRNMYGAWPGFWAGFGWLMLPGVWFSSSIISTDALLLPLWAIALFAMWRLVNTRAWTWALVLGAFVGLGVLAKYAMLYFFLCTAVAAWRIEPVRQALAKGRGWLASVVALIVMSPNIVWNAQNGFVTAAHTAENAHFDAQQLFNIDELFEFNFGQAFVIGPLIFCIFVWVLWRAWRRSGGLSTEEKFLITYILPPFIIINVIAFISRANANWAAVAYPALLLLVTGTLFASRAGRRTLFAATGVNVALGAALIAIVAFEPALANQFKGVRTARAWQETAREIALRATPQRGEPPFTAVMVDDRATYYELSYYWREMRRANAPLPPVRMWLLHGQARNSAESTNPMRPEEGGRVLVVHLTPQYLPLVATDFASFRTVEHLTVPLGGGVNREFEISIGEGFAPLPRDAAFEERRRQQVGGR